MLADTKPQTFGTYLGLKGLNGIDLADAHGNGAVGSGYHAESARGARANPS